MRYKGIVITNEIHPTSEFQFTREYETVERKSENVLVNLAIIIHYEFIDGPRYRCTRVPKGLSMKSLEEFKIFLKIRSKVSSFQAMESSIEPVYMFRLFKEYHWRIVDRLPENIYIV